MEQEVFIEKSKKIAIKLQEEGCSKIEILDISKKSSQSKVMIIASTEDAQKSKVVASDLEVFLPEQDIQIQNIDGGFKGEWIGIDCKEILINIFVDDVRAKYNLEKLWKDSKNIIKWK